MITVDKKQKCIDKINNSDLSDDDKAFIVEVLKDEKGIDLMKILSYIRAGVDIFKIARTYFGDESGDS